MSSSVKSFYKLNAGANARKGFKFQDYVGIYLMLYYYKRKIEFSVLFETRDDLEANTEEEKIKIQVKSNHYTLNKIYAKDKDSAESTYEKLMKKTDVNFDKFMLSCCSFNDKEKNDYLHKIDHELDNIYNIKGYTKYKFDPKFHVHLVPFADNFKSAEYYVLGFAKDEMHEKSIDLDNHINNLVKRVGELGEYIIECKSDYKKKTMTGRDFEKIEIINSKASKKNIILNDLSHDLNSDFTDGIRAKLSLLNINPNPELSVLSQYKLPEIDDEKYSIYFKKIYDDIIQKYNINDKKLIYAWAINKYVGEVLL